MAKTMNTITIEDSNGNLVTWEFADTETRERTEGITGLTQETGTDEGLVMSQSAVTEALESQETEVVQGTNGYTFTPSVSAEGVISWTNDGGLANPSPVNIKGPQGERGLQGVQGERGPAGEAGPEGPQGPAGIQGIQGEQGPQGETGSTGPAGPAGATGAAGPAGADGVSCTHSWNGTTLTVTSASGSTSSNLQGPRGERGIEGAPGDGGYTVPAYWQDAVDTAIESVKAAQDAGGLECVTFAYFSDLHHQVSNPSMAAYTENIGAITAAVMDACDIPLCLMAGDTAENACPSTEEEPLVDLEAAANIMKPIGYERLMQIRGNHDDVYGSSGSVYYVNKIDQAKIWNRIFRAQAQDFRRVFGGDGSYFYIDNEPQKVRFICLNSYFYGGEPITNGTTYGMNGGLGAAQLEWLSVEALPTDREGWSVVIGMHTPPATINGTNYLSQLWDGDLFVGIIEAYCDKTSYSGTYPSSTAWKNASVSVNYANSNVAEVIGVFCGHCHYDDVIMNALPCPVVSITSATNLTYDANEGTRTQGTATETAVDFVCVNKKDKAINIVRLGIGSNRAFKYDGSEVMYSVTSNLTNVSISNAATSVTNGAAYNVMLTAADGYELSSVTVTMGGADVTATAYSNGIVSIASVTGDIVITATATAVEVGPSYTNQLPLAVDSSGNVVGIIEGYRYNSSGSLVSNTYGVDASGYIPVKAGDIVRFANWTFRAGMGNYGSCYIDNFDASFAAKYKATPGTVDSVYENVKDSDGDVIQVTVKCDGYIAVCSTDLTENTIITVNEVIE